MSTPTRDESPRTTLVVVTGLSGAGKSKALHALEDLGFFCMDNVPTLLAPQAVALCETGGMVRIGLGMDARVRAFLGEVGNVLALLDNGGQRDLHVLFLDASDETLLRRFNETRRPHPLTAEAGERSASDGVAVLDGVRLERERLAPVRARATRIVDTTSLSVHDLRRIIIGHFGPTPGGSTRMVTRIVSFGFKYGAPVDADLVLDVRFLDNPHFIPELKPLTGLDLPVARYVLNLSEAQEFMQKARDLLQFVMPKYEREGKSYLTIAIGCTGGRHRSVAIAEAIGSALAASLGTPIAVVHRDAGRKVVSTAEADPMEAAPQSVSEMRAALSPIPAPTQPPPPFKRGQR